MMKIKILGGLFFMGDNQAGMIGNSLLQAWQLITLRGVMFQGIKVYGKEGWLACGAAIYYDITI